MSAQITTAYINKYKSDLKMLLQQSESKFEPHVEVESQDAEFEFHDQIGPVSAQPYGPRHGDTPLSETPHERRVTTIEPFIWAELIDKPDRVRIAMSPDSKYTKNAVSAFKRRKDDVIIAGMLGVVMTGKEGKTPVSLPEINYKRETGNGLITIEKLATIRKFFWNHDLEDSEQLVMAVSPDSIEALILDPKVSSADYNTVRALVRGEIDSFMGIKFIRTTRLPWKLHTAGDPTKGIIRTNPVWVKSGVLMTKGQDIQVDVDKRPDKKNATQLMVTMDIGAKRMEENKVMVLETYEKDAAVIPAP